MAIQSIISFTILLCIDYNVFSKAWFFIRPNRRWNTNVYVPLGTITSENSTIPAIVEISDSVQIRSTGEDEDVKAETERIQTTPNHTLMQTDVLVLNQVEKVYNGMFRAVDQLSVGVKRSECFGLLGVNGA
jgi:hypothetical protein